MGKTQLNRNTNTFIFCFMNSLFSKTAAKVLLFFHIHKFSPLFSLLFGIFSFLLLPLSRVSLGLRSVLCLFPSSGIGGLALRCPLAYNPAPHSARGRLVSSPKIGEKLRKQNKNYKNRHKYTPKNLHNPKFCTTFAPKIHPICI